MTSTTGIMDIVKTTSLNQLGKINHDNKTMQLAGTYKQQTWLAFVTVIVANLCVCHSIANLVMENLDERTLSPCSKGMWKKSIGRLAFLDTEHHEDGYSL